jgi:agmatinase
MTDEAARFFGLPEEFCDPETAAAAILPVPYDATSTWKKGADRGPAAILAASSQVELYDIKTGTEPYRAGIATLPEIRFDGPPEALAERVAARAGEVLDRGQLPVILGGEHSVSIGAMRAAAERHPGLSFLQIDAHGDTRESYEGSTHNHACVMARARELGPIVQVGIRAVDAAEMATMDAERVFFAHDIRDRAGSRNDTGTDRTGDRNDSGTDRADRRNDSGSDRADARNDTWIERAVALLGPEVYVTIDLDAFDPSLVPATGTPEPGGLGWYQVMDLLAAVTAARRVVAFDVVELLPQPGQHASDFLAAKLVYRLLAMIWAARPAASGSER